MESMEIEEEVEELEEEEIEEDQEKEKRKERPSKEEEKEEKIEEGEEQNKKEVYDRSYEESRLNNLRRILEDIKSGLEDLSKRETKFRGKINTTIKAVETTKVSLDFIFEALDKTPKIVFSKKGLNTTILKVKRAKTSLIPMVRLAKLPEIKRRSKKLENMIPRSKGMTIAIRTPILRVKKLPRMAQIVQLIKDVPEHHLLKENSLEKTYNLTKESQGVAIFSTSPPREPSLESHEPPPDVFEVFNIKPIYGRVISRRPKIIIVRENGDDVGGFTRILEIICKRIYREVTGGLPRSIIGEITLEESTDKDKKKLNLLRVLENSLRFKIGGAIWSILISKEAKNERRSPNTEIRKFFEKIRDRISEMYSQDLGFLIIGYKEEDFPEHPEEISKELLRVLGISIRTPRSTESLHSAHIPDIIVCDSEHFMMKTRKEDIISAMWGFVDIRKECREIEKRYHSNTEISFDLLKLGTLFEIAMKRHDRILKKLASNEILQLIVNPSEEESWLHYAIKAFVVQYLLREKLHIELKDLPNDLTRVRDKISTETGEGGIIPDVTFKDGGYEEAYEIETLFGTGEIPTLKIHRTLKKYVDPLGQGTSNEKYDSVNIVFDNLTAAIHIRELLKIENLYEKMSKAQQGLHVPKNKLLYT